MKRLLMAATVAAAFAATADNDWQVDAGTGSASGSITNDANWSQGASAAQQQCISKLLSATAPEIKVTVPDGYVTPGTGLKLGVTPGQTLELAGGDYLMPGPVAPTQYTNPFWFGLYDGSGWRGLLWASFKNDAYKSKAAFRWEDLKAKLTASGTGEKVTIDISGTFAFTNNFNEVAAFGSSIVKDATIRFCDGANFLDYGDFLMRGWSDTNRVVFVGGTHFIQGGAVQFYDYGQGWDAAKEGLMEMRFEEGASMDVTGQNIFYMGGAGPARATSNKTMRVVISGGSRLNLPNRTIVSREAGTVEISVTGTNSEHRFGGNFQLPMRSSDSKKAQKIVSRLAVTDGGYLNGYGASSHLTIGTDNTYGDALDCPSTVAVTNATVFVGGYLYMNCGMFDSVGSDLRFSSVLLGQTANPSAMTVSGGTLNVTGNNKAVVGSTGLGTLTLSDGATLTAAGKVTVGEQAGSDGTLVLKNGAVYPGLEIAGGSGTSALVADGGILRPTAAAANLLHGLTSAKLTAKGLTVESDNAVTIAQSFGNAPDENGVLTLRGTGVKTLSGTATGVSRIVLQEGSLVFTDAARCASTVVVTNGASVAFGASAVDGTLKGLVLGDAESAATLVLTPNKKIAVDGPVALDHLRLFLESGFAQGTYTVLEATGSVSAATRTAWQDALVISGVPNGCVPTFASEETSGTTVFTMTLAPAVERRITVTEGTTQTVATVEHYSANETLTVDVQEGAAANVTAALGAGNFVKEGRGALTLTSAENDFFGRLSTFGGLFAVPNLLALGFERFGLGTFTLGAGTLQLGEAGADEQRFEPQLVVDTPADGTPGVVIKADSDIVMGIPRVRSGAIIKRGAGRVTFEVSGSDNVLTVTNACSKWAESHDGGGRIDFDAEGGFTPASTTANYGGFTVVDGEVVIRGLDDAATVTAPHYTIVGLSPSEWHAEAGLVFDHVHYVTKTRFAYGMGMLSTVIPNSIMPYIVVTNGAVLECSAFRPAFGDGLYYPRLHPRITVCGSTVKAGEYWTGNSDWILPEHIYLNGSRLLTPTILYSNMTTNMIFDASVVAKDADHDFMTVSDQGGSSYNDVRRMTFRNGSSFYCKKIDVVNEANKKSWRLFFDDSEWIPATGDYAFSYASNVVTVVMGTGLVLTPPADATWRVAMPVTGTGGIVKRGAGALVFDTRESRGAKYADSALTLDCTGTIAVEEGTLRVLPDAPRAGLSFDVAAGATLDLTTASIANATIAGAGTVTGGTLADLTIVPDASDGVTLDGATLNGSVTVDFARTAEDPVAPGTYVVARYTGAAPSLVGWKAKGFGRRGLMVEFVARDGVITAKVCEKGLTVIIR